MSFRPSTFAQGAPSIVEGVIFVTFVVEDCRSSTASSQLSHIYSQPARPVEKARRMLSVVRSGGPVQ